MCEHDARTDVDRSCSNEKTQPLSAHGQKLLNRYQYYKIDSDKIIPIDLKHSIQFTRTRSVRQI